MSGEIELAPQRALTHLVGHDADGFFGRHSLAALRARTGDLPANSGAFPLRSAEEYYGQVATNCRIATAQATDGISTFTRTRHTLRADVTELAVRFPNWFANRAGDKFETAVQAQVAVSASIEYPTGTLTQMSFAGASQGFIDAGGDLCTDFLPITLAAGAEIHVRIAVYGSVGYVHANFRQNDYAAEGCTASTSRTADLTRRFGTPDPATRSVGTWPVGIIARTTHGGVLGIGDSIVEGTGDAYAADDASDGGFGLIGRAVSSSHAYISGAMAGDDLETATRSCSNRLALARYVKNIVFEHGVNSIAGGATLAAMQANMLALWTRGAGSARTGARLFQTTLTPETNSTDSWATLENQTARTNFSISGSGVREQLNDWLRDGAPLLAGVPVAAGTVGALRAGETDHPLHGVFDVADVVESSRNSGKWKVDGTAGKYTADGIHPTRFTNVTVAASGAIDTAQFA
ncbi:SGNH/GDSL hydrolase family protein [Ancylobacter oerskovii]|uniref:SGNH/GDSL hydrolase family protein n=1 Tax=Ancylobacter oerskovii TaxID=459519 RepID=A0ABW4YY00_9HYPH|nr:SGNH/GDSL hydrolase family protein [Ancylobacter oerskovii]MBS7541995.1 hypothetical protein [Ancylobacter oerskovii]